MFLADYFKGINSFDSSNKITLISGNEKIEKYLSSDDELSALGNTMKNNILLTLYKIHLYQIVFILSSMKSYLWNNLLINVLFIIMNYIIYFLN